jgi:hypothetical protein
MDGTQFHSGLVSQQIKYFANIQNNKCTKDVFDLYADSSTERISLPAFVKAVQKLGSVSKEEDISRLFTAAKVDGKDSLDYDGFCMAVRRQSKLEQWPRKPFRPQRKACFSSFDFFFAAAAVSSRPSLILRHPALAPSEPPSPPRLPPPFASRSLLPCRAASAPPLLRPPLLRPPSGCVLAVC